MNDFVTFQQDQTAQKLLGKASYQLQGETPEVMTFDKFVKVHPEKLSRDAEMAAEVEALHKVDHTVLIRRILL